MKLNPKKILFGERQDKKPPVLLAVTPPRTGERTMLGVENMLQSIAVPEPFSLELAGDVDGVTLMARCLNDQVVRGQVSAHYPQARIHEVSEQDDPLRLVEGEEAWSMTLRASGPEYVPLRTFRDDDLLDPGSDPIIALLGALSNLNEEERVVTRLMLRSLGPDWSQGHLEKAHKRPVPEPRDSSYSNQVRHQQTDVNAVAILGVAALIGLRGYLWVRAGETWKAALMGVGVAAALTVAGWAWWRIRKARSRVYDPLLIKEKVARIAFDAEIQVVAVLPKGEPKESRERARELLGPVAAAYRHYDHPAGARFKVAGSAARCPQPVDDAPVRPRPVRGPERPGSPRGRRPVAPARSRGRDAPRGALRRKGSPAVGARREGRSAGGRHHGGQAPTHQVPRRPAPPPPPLRRPHPNGQVHPHAPPGGAQDA